MDIMNTFRVYSSDNYGILKYNIAIFGIAFKINCKILFPYCYLFIFLKMITKNNEKKKTKTREKK